MRMWMLVAAVGAALLVGVWLGYCGRWDDAELVMARAALEEAEDSLVVVRRERQQLERELRDTAAWAKSQIEGLEQRQDSLREREQNASVAFDRELEVLAATLNEQQRAQLSQVQAAHDDQVDALASQVVALEERDLVRLSEIRVRDSLIVGLREEVSRERAAKEAALRVAEAAGIGWDDRGRWAAIGSGVTLIAIAVVKSSN